MSKTETFCITQAISAMITAMGMQAENKQRELNGLSMAYTADAFQEVILEHGIGCDDSKIIDSLKGEVEGAKEAFNMEHDMHMTCFKRVRDLKAELSRIKSLGVEEWALLLYGDKGEWDKEINAVKRAYRNEATLIHKKILGE